MLAPTSHQIATLLLEGARTNGGATVSPHDGTAPVDGYMVGRPGHGVTMPLEGADLADIVRWVDSARVGAARVDYLGSWVADGTLYLDISERFGSRGVALIVADSRNELAIWAVASATEIAV